MLCHLATGLAGDEGDGPRTLARVLHQHGFAKGVAVARKERVRDLLDRAVDRPDDRNLVQQPVPLAQPPLAEDVGDEHACQQQAHAQHQHAQPWHVAQLSRWCRAPKPAAAPAARSSSQANTPSITPSSPRQHPDGDGQRRPHQQAGKQVFLHAWLRGGRARLVGSRRRRQPALPPRAWSSAVRAGWLAHRRAFASALSSVAGDLATTEVGRVPARTLQLETGRGELLGIGRRTAGRAGAQHGIGNLLQHVLPVSAGLAFVGVDRHGVVRTQSRQL